MTGTSSRFKLGWRLAALAAVLVVGGTSLATAAIGRSDGAAQLAATIEARAQTTQIKSCAALPAVQKLEGRYLGTMTLDGDEYALNFTLEALVDRSAGLGSAEGRWQLTDPRSGGVVARGELVAIVTAAQTPDPELEPPDPELEPPDPELEPPDPDAQPPDPNFHFHGVLTGLVSPPDADQPAQKLVASFSASLDEQGLNFSAEVGVPPDRLGAGVLLPAIRC